MPAFANPLNNNLIKLNEQSCVEHGVDIVDFNTVSYDKNSSRPKKSLSLNVYKYKQILEPEKQNEFLVTEESSTEKESELHKRQLSTVRETKNEKLSQRDQHDPKSSINVMCILFVIFFVTCLSVSCLVTLIALSIDQKFSDVYSSTDIQDILMVSLIDYHESEMFKPKIKKMNK